MPALLIALTLCTPSPILSSGQLSASLALAVVPESRLELERELGSLREKRAHLSPELGWTLLVLSVPLLGAGIPLLISSIEWLNSLNPLLAFLSVGSVFLPFILVVGGASCLLTGASILLVTASLDSQITSVEEQLRRSVPAPPGVTLHF
jgi:hypothetical protein